MRDYVVLSLVFHTTPREITPVIEPDTKVYNT